MPNRTISKDSFATVSSVVVDKSHTWEDRVFLTFDIDWAHDDVLAYSIDLVDRIDIPATWYVTHDTPLLDRLRSNPKYELGIHPNYIPLLMNGDPSKGATAAEVVDRVLAIVPEATSVRAHSLVQSGRLLGLYRERGLTHESSCFIPDRSGIVLRPWTDWAEMVRVPYFWEDDVWCDAIEKGGIEDLEARPGIRGYDFHPIHLFLNSEKLDRYDSARPDFSNPSKLAQRRFEGAGTRTFFDDLLARVE